MPFGEKLGKDLNRLVEMALARPRRGFLLLLVLGCSGVCAQQTTQSTLSSTRIEVTPPLAPSDLVEIQSFQQSARGDLLLAWSKDYKSAGFSMLSPALKPKWSMRFNQEWRGAGAKLLIDAKEGGYLGVGYGLSRDIEAEERDAHTRPDRREAAFEYVVKFDEAGHVVWKKNVTEKGAPRIYCAAAAVDGFWLVGFDTKTYRSPDNDNHTEGSVYWVGKFDNEGRLSWERILDEDGGKPVAPLDTRFAKCNGLRVSDDGAMTWAFEVRPVKTQSRTLNGTTYLEIVEADALETLVVQFDSSGHELNRTRSLDAQRPELFANPTGFTLVEHYTPPEARSIFKPPMSNSDVGGMMAESLLADEKAGVRVSLLNRNLRMAATHEYRIPELRQLEAALPDRRGGYLLAGCDRRGMNYVYYVDRNGRTARPQSLGPTLRCGDFGLAQLDDDQFILYSNATGSLLRNVRLVD